MTQPNSNATKIMIIRHAEKPPKNPPPDGVDIKGHVKSDSLIVLGWQRAGALVVLFAPSRGSFQDPQIATPQFIYASSTSDSAGNRPQETVTPLIVKLNLVGSSVNFTFAKDDVCGVAKSALNCQGVVLISWPHDEIPPLAEQIPLSPNNTQPIPTHWPGHRFDMVWVFDFDSDSSTGGYIFSQVPQLLLAGDSSEPIKEQDL